MIVLDVFWRHVDELAEGWLETGGEPIDPKRSVPTVSVFGVTVPAALGAKLKRLGNDPAEALDKLLGGGPEKPAKQPKVAKPVESPENGQKREVAP